MMALPPLRNMATARPRAETKGSGFVPVNYFNLYRNIS
jgi:hypothetical protein